MALSLWAQGVFSKGEISPLMYARTDVQAYFNGLKLAKNIITFPQGAAGKRFGTEYWNTITGITDANQSYFQTFQYLNECVYILVFVPLSIQIYLEGVLVATVVTIYTANQIQQMDHTVLQDTFITSTFSVTNGPRELKRADHVNNPILGFSSIDKTLTLTGPDITPGGLYPCRFTGTLPTTSPQVASGQTYFSRFITTTTIKLYKTSTDAKNDINPFDISAFGGGNYIKRNSWSIADIVAQNKPSYDFGEVDYSGITFTLSAIIVGRANLHSLSGGVGTNYFKVADVGGVFKQGPGLARITAFVNAQNVTVEIVKSFDVKSRVGSFCFVGEPAWSATRGYPQKTSSYQNRLIFANTDLIPNGIWLSAINDFYDFDDIDTDDDDAISYYPTSGNLSLVNHITPYRSLTVHTNNGIYSTPLNLDAAITPTNFSLTMQDSTPAGVVTPVSIDNQIVVVSGNDVYSMMWDGLNNSYTSKIVSIISEQVISNPTSQASFSDLIKAGSRYVFIVNGDGSLAIFQTLIAEEVLGWSRAFVEQSYGEAYYRNVTSNFDGRAWFLVERELGTLDVSAAVASINTTETNTITATAFGLTVGDVIQVTFTTTGTLPTTSPQIVADLHYWAVGITATEFALYSTKEDAAADINRTTISAVGANSTAHSYPLVSNFLIEELDFDSYVDCAVKYSGTAIGNVSGVPRFDGQETVSNGDGYGFSSVGYGGNVYYDSHGASSTVSIVQTGYPINVAIQPLPLSISMGSNIATSNVVEPKHVRNATFMFNNTIGGEINGKPIALTTFSQVDFGVPPTSRNGIYSYSVMKGWNDFKTTSFNITHSEPFDIKLIGIFYKVEV